MDSFMLLWESICCFSTFHTLVILDILCFLLHWEVWMNWHITVFSKDHTKWNGTKGYAISSMLYPLLRVIMLPLAAVLMDTIGMPWLFIGQGLFSICAALIENTIQLTEETRVCEKHFLFRYGKKIFKKFSAILKKNVDYRLFTTIWQPQMGSLPDMLPFWSHFSYRPRNVRRTLFFIFHC